VVDSIETPGWWVGGKREGKIAATGTGVDPRDVQLLPSKLNARGGAIAGHPIREYHNHDCEMRRENERWRETPPLGRDKLARDDLKGRKRPRYVTLIDCPLLGGNSSSHVAGCIYSQHSAPGWQ
jgi:hypothetical protein